MALDLKHFFTDPLPDFAFEISGAGVSWVRPSAPGVPAFEPLESDVLAISPLRDNVQRPEALSAAIGRISGNGGTRKRRRGVLILPDYCARVAVLDFDSFPSDPAEQASLVRFRMKKAVPFDVESAVVRFHPQPSGTGSSRLNVVVVVASLEILARYEAPFRAAGIQIGLVTTSSLAALELDGGRAVAILAKVSGRVLSVSVLSHGVLRLLRTVELPDVDADEMLGVLHPTAAFVEDEFGARPDRLLTCGLDAGLSGRMEQELGIAAEPLHSRWGAPSQANAGLLGYLESLQ